jgi:CubicO group peptidase (beta-lactamase class C family)
MRPLDNVAPAGGINASARDMGQWLRLLLGRGAVDGRRLISEQSFARLWQPYIEDEAYGLGWELHKWNGKSQVAHDGGIDEFVTRVALLPKENIAFGLFTNIAFNRDIGRARVVFDGEHAADYVDFAPIEDPLPAQADDIRVRAWFNPYEDGKAGSNPCGWWVTRKWVGRRSSSSSSREPAASS